MAQPPDLVPQSVTFSSTSITVGGNLTINVTVSNQGSGSAVSTYTAVRLSTNPNTSSPSDPQVNVFTPALAAGGSATVSGTFTGFSRWAPTTPTFTWTITRRSPKATLPTTLHDPQAITVAALPPPDLVPQSVTFSSTSITVGGNLTINVTVSNQGSGSAVSTYTAVRLSTNPNTSSPAIRR